jgi:hypothetical protein
MEADMLTKLKANFRIIWNDLKHGENIGLKEELIPPLTLGILSMLAISILVSRHKMENIA